jgi:hypothetical protein
MGSTLRPQERIAFSVGEPVTSAVPPSYRQENILTWMTLFGMTGEFHWKYLQLYAEKYKQKRNVPYCTSGENTAPAVFCTIPSISRDATLLDINPVLSQGFNFVSLKYTSTTVI